MNILFCTSEASPFISTGGLGEIGGSLPKALCSSGEDCRAVIPLYKGINAELKKDIKFIKSLSVSVAWRNQYCGVFEAEHSGVKYYFLDNKYYFDRDNIYGYYDDGERFAFFSRAILDMLKEVDFKPDVIHCNDWQTALVSVYHDSIYKYDDWYANIKTVFTIHNIQYQGNYSKDVLNELIGVPEEKQSILEFNDCINLMKGGIEASRFVTTVSPTYAKEIMNPWYSHGLDCILKNREWKVKGILNGIDTEIYNPSDDNLIYENYDVNTIDKKSINKCILQKRLDLQENKNVPLLAMVTRLAEHKGIDLVEEVFERMINERDFQFVILGVGEQKYEKLFEEMARKYTGKVSCCKGFVKELSNKIYAASDMFLMPSKSEPCGLSQMIAMRYGSIPIVRKTGGLNDTVSDSGDEIGVGFTFQNYDAFDMLQAVYRALDGYKNLNGWEILVKRAMSIDNSWGNRVADYEKVYNL